jgi:uncharacterized membrane protein YkvA (DUF1232 family)
MVWVYWAVAVVTGVIFVSLGLFMLVRWMSNRTPYDDFMRMRTRQKLRFFRLLLRDREGRIPLYVKLVPVLLVLYLSMPFDIIPDFVPVLGYLDDVAVALLALALIIRLVPRPVILELIREASAGATPATQAADQTEQS